MRTRQLVIASTLAVAVPIVAGAQTTTDQTVTTTTTTTTQIDTDWSDRNNQWLASAFAGTAFGQDADEASLDFGGSFGYLWRGIVGAEFQANFAPEFDLEPRRRALLAGDSPFISSYMVNAIGALPIGGERRWQPYVSGGLGALLLRSDAIEDPGSNAIDPDDARFGGNIGGGFLAFWGPAGVRADVRYFRGFEDSGDEIESPTEAIGTQVLSQLSFWRANVGLAFRW